MRMILTFGSAVVLTLSMGCSSARVSSSGPTLRQYSGTSSNRDNYLGWDVRYSMDTPVSYSFSDQEKLTAPKPTSVTSTVTSAALGPDGHSPVQEKPGNSN